MSAPLACSLYYYSGNLTQVWDPALKWKTYTSDVFGNLVSVVEPDTSNNFNNVTAYTYNVLNRLTKVTMQTGSGPQTRTFTYDQNTQRLTETNNPENGIVSQTPP